MVKAPPSAGRRRNLTEEDLNDGQTVRSDAFIDVATVTGTRKKFYSHGYGDNSRFSGASGYAYADFQDDAGNPINGTLRLAAYESEDLEVPKALMAEYDLESLRESVDEARSDREIISAMAGPTGVSQDEVLVWEIKAHSDSDGAAIGAANCNVKLPFSEYRRS